MKRLETRLGGLSGTHFVRGLKGELRVVVDEPATDDLAQPKIGPVAATDRRPPAAV
jgi:hypothetical protein